MVHITNVVVQADLQVKIDLTYLTNHSRDVQYDPARFTGVIWRHKKIGGSCLVFSNGKINCNGNKNLAEAKRRVRQYARLIQKQGFPVLLKTIHLITMSAVHIISSPLNLKEVHETLGAVYEPETLNAAILKKQRMNFNCFQSGAVVITGIRSMRDLNNIVYPTLLELELCTS